MTLRSRRIEDRLRARLARDGLAPPRAPWRIRWPGPLAFVWLFQAWFVFNLNSNPHVTLLLGAAATAVALLAVYVTRTALTSSPTMECLLSLPLADHRVCLWQFRASVREVGTIGAATLLLCAPQAYGANLDTPVAWLALLAACTLTCVCAVAVAALCLQSRARRYAGTVSMVLVALCAYLVNAPLDGSGHVDAAALLPPCWPLLSLEDLYVHNDVQGAWVLLPTLLLAASIPLLLREMARTWRVLDIGRTQTSQWTLPVRPVTSPPGGVVDWHRGLARVTAIWMSRRDRQVAALMCPHLGQTSPLDFSAAAWLLCAALAYRWGSMHALCALGLLSTLSILAPGGLWPGIANVMRPSGPLVANLPVGYTEVASLMLKVNTCRVLLWLPLAIAAESLARGYASCTLSLPLALIVLALLPLSLAGAFADCVGKSGALVDRTSTEAVAFVLLGLVLAAVDLLYLLAGQLEPAAQLGLIGFTAGVSWMCLIAYRQRWEHGRSDVVCGRIRELGREAVVPVVGGLKVTSTWTQQAR